jgi:hypothetical protein
MGQPRGQELRFALQSGTRLDRDGQPVTYREGEAWAAEAQFVKDNRDLFGTEPNVVRGLPDTGPTFAEKMLRIERGTNKPGTRR